MRAIIALIMIVFLGMVIFTGWAAYENERTCTRHAMSTCYQPVCDVQIPIYDGDGDFDGLRCIASHSEPYPCRVCVEHGGERNEGR